jgi:hypothetical protein
MPTIQRVELPPKTFSFLGNHNIHATALYLLRPPTAFALTESFSQMKQTRHKKVFDDHVEDLHNAAGLLIMMD